MRRKRFVLLIGLLILVAVATMAVAQPGANAATPGQGKVQLQFLIELPQSPAGTPTRVGELVKRISNIGSSGEDGFTVDSFFDIQYVSNIGSSGLDGNTATFQVDSFFDVFYEIEFDNSGNRTLQTEMLSMDLSGTLNDPANPAGAIDAVTRAVNEAGGHVHGGHVTILK